MALQTTNGSYGTKGKVAKLVKNLKVGKHEDDQVTIKTLLGMNGVTDQVNSESLEIPGDGGVFEVLDSGATSATLTIPLAAFTNDTKVDILGYEELADGKGIALTDESFASYNSWSWIEYLSDGSKRFVGYLKGKAAHPEETVSGGTSLSENGKSLTVTAIPLTVESGKTVLKYEFWDFDEADLPEFEALVHANDYNLDTTEPEGE